MNEMLTLRFNVLREKPHRITVYGTVKGSVFRLIIGLECLENLF